ncbi:MAG: hypothetical protein GY788_24765 [bacterium]|nr:hypothetical protein [bacterium]
MVWIAFAAVLVGVVAGALQLRWDQSGVVLTGVIAIATVAYAGFTWRLVRAGELDRQQQRAETDRQELLALRSLLLELTVASNRKGKTHAWHAHVPFDRAAFDAARGFLGSLSDETVEQLLSYDVAIARYNALARYNELRVSMGSGAADEALREHASTASEAAASALHRLEGDLAASQG